MCREKLLLCNACPYRKPTQVDEERILRPTEEALLRNSDVYKRQDIEYVAELEKEMLEKINNLGIGPCLLYTSRCV